MTIEKKIFANKEFSSTQAETQRVYKFAKDGKLVEVVVEEPLWLHVSKSGGHYLVMSDSSTKYIPPGWVDLTWYNKPGTGPIQF